MASIAARGARLDPALGGAGGEDHAVEPGPDLVHPLPGQGAEPGDPPRDAQALGQSLQLLLGGPGADHGDGPAADQLHAGAEQQVESLLRDEPAEEPDGEPGLIAARTTGSGSPTPSWGITWCASEGCCLVASWRPAR